MTFSDIFKSSFLENVTSISILDMALALAVTVLFMNGEKLGIQVIRDEDSEKNESSQYFTANDQNTGWTAATTITLNGDTAALSGPGAYANGGSVTITAANADLLEMDLGENESLGDIIRQTRRLRTLTEDLTLLSRMEEAEDTLQKVDFPLSDTVSEAAAPFRTLARQQEKLFTLSIQPLLTLRGDAKAIRQLTELLLDNALKYSPPGGAIDLTLSRQGRTATLTVTNATGTDIDPDQLPRLFDRFYRTDASRNSGTGGYGIGLSVAKAIVTAHGGSIRAISDGPRTFRIRASLPY